MAYHKYERNENSSIKFLTVQDIQSEEFLNILI